MKPIICIALSCLYFNSTVSQYIPPEIRTLNLNSEICGRCIVRSPAYIDSCLFTTYLRWNLAADSLPITGKPPKRDTIEVWYIVSKEGKISSAKFRNNEKNAFSDFVVQKFLNCPYQWTPAYQNGRAISDFFKWKIVL